jgi:hypothetical protein
MWERGATAPPWLLGAALAASNGLCNALVFKRETTFRSRAGHAAHVVAVGCIASVGTLLLLNRVGPEDRSP